MDQAKASVKKFIGKSGQHDTTVHEEVAPAVQHETIARAEHEKVMPVLDKEVHQTHYHTTEQPVAHSEVLPETHHHTETPVESRTFEHGKLEDTKRSLADERSKYQHTQTRVEGDRTQSTEPTVVGERVHHHVHETIQPVVHKETVEPHVVHKTVPIHEVHHNQPQHHGASTLPPVSMGEFKNQGGSLKGREERTDVFSGEPRNFPGDGGSVGSVGGLGHDSRSTNTGSGPLNTSSTNPLNSSSGTPMNTSSGTPLNSSSGTPMNTSSTGNYDSTSGSTGAASKPGLMDRLNPKKDTTGDGKPGVMS